MYPLDWQLLDITVLELYPIYVPLSMFEDDLEGRTVMFYCDNIAVQCMLHN